MLELYYQYPRVLNRLRAGTLGGAMDRIAARFSETGYKPASAKVYLAHIAQFDRFLSLAGCKDPHSISSDLVERFLDRCINRRQRLSSQTAIRHLLQVVNGSSINHRAEPQCGNSGLLREYGRYLQDVRGLRIKTCEGLMLAARRILKWYDDQNAGEPLSAMTAETVISLVGHLLSASGSYCTRSGSVSDLRSFLRFMNWQGLVSEDLSRFVPRVPCWRMAHLPPRLSWDDVNRIVDGVGINDPAALRDRALLLLLATTGLRSRELRALELRDIHWRTGEVMIRSNKGRRDRLVPLSSAAGDALATYILSGRPSTHFTQVFLCHYPPVRPITHSSTLAAIVRRRLERCDLHFPKAGAHLLRHSLATQLVKQRRPIKEVADLLGHRNIDTTAIYVKVALPQLATVALPFPGSES